MRKSRKNRPELEGYYLSLLCRNLELDIEYLKGKEFTLTKIKKDDIINNGDQENE